MRMTGRKLIIKSHAHGGSNVNYHVESTWVQRKLISTLFLMNSKKCSEFNFLAVKNNHLKTGKKTAGVKTKDLSPDNKNKLTQEN